VGALPALRDALPLRRAVIANCSASNETIGKAEYRRLLVSSTSARLLCGYVYCSAGPGESTQDMVFSGTIIAENGDGSGRKSALRRRGAAVH
jgi:hypothetical protein